MDEHPDVSVVLVNYNTAHLLDRLFSALAAGTGMLRVQVIAVDNASRDNSVEVLRTRYPWVELIVNETNVGFGRANNQALGLARGRYILLLNTDAFVSRDTLPKTVSYMEAHPECGVLGVKLVGEEGNVQPSCRFFPSPWNVFLLSTGLHRFFSKAQLIDDPHWDPVLEQECDWVPGCYYLVRREVIERVGLFDPRYFLYYEEVDHCRAVKAAGWKVLYYPDTQVVHIGGESAESTGGLNTQRQVSSLQIESELLYWRKHYGIAGVLAAFLLSATTDVTRGASALLRRGNTEQARAHLKHLGAMLGLLIQTRFASAPTR
jgi:GT2 family glycosyltransferase